MSESEGRHAQMSICKLKLLSRTCATQALLLPLRGRRNSPPPLAGLTKRANTPPPSPFARVSHSTCNAYHAIASATTSSIPHLTTMPSRDVSPNRKDSGSAPTSPGKDGLDKVELSDLDSSPPPLPIESDLMQLARLGELRAIQKLFDSGRYNAKSTDDQGITALHVWEAHMIEIYTMHKKLI